MRVTSLLTKQSFFMIALIAFCLLGLPVDTAEAVGPPGANADFDMNGVVDHQDLALWASEFGFGGSADADADGNSDINDLFIWKQEEGSDLFPLSAPLVSIGPEVLYNPTTGVLSIAPKGLDIYAVFLSLNGSHVINVSNAELPSSSNGSWDLRDFGTSIQGYDASMLSYATPVQSDNSLDQLAGIAKIADLQPGLDAGDFGSLRYGLAGDDSVGAFALVIVPEPAALTLIAVGLLGFVAVRQRQG